MIDNAVKIMKNNTGKISLISGMIFAFFLPLAKHTSIVFFDIWMGLTIFDNIINKKKFEFSFKKNSLPAYLLFIYYILMIISFIYSDNTHYFYKQLGMRTLFLLAPFIVSLKFDESYNYKFFIISFILGCIVSLLFLSSFPVYEYLSDFKLRNTYNKNPLLTYKIRSLSFEHKTYTGLNFLFAIVSCIYLRNDFLKVINKKKYYIFLALFIFLIVVYSIIIGSRITLIAFIFVTFSYIFNYLFHSGYKTGASLTIIFGICSVILLFLFHPKFKNIEMKSLFGRTNIETKDPRVGIWISSIDLLEDDNTFIWGAGVGDVKDLLLKKYKENNFKLAQKYIYNAHNTFLNSLIEIGIPGFLILLFMLLSPLAIKKRKERRYLFYLVACTFFVMMVESMMNNIKGVLALLILMIIPSFISSTRKKDNDFIMPAKYVHGTGFVILLVLIIAVSVFSFFSFSSNRYDPEDPYTYAEHEYKPVEKLPGNPPVVLRNCTGCLLDAQSTGTYLPDYNITVSYTNFFATEKDTVFSVWCYVSKDFDGSDVLIATNTYDKEYMFYSGYDLSKKSTWQHLSFKFSRLPGDIPAFCFFQKKDAKSFKDLTGYVIFALPKFN